VPKTKIILKDELADLFVGELVADVNSVREAVSCMEANFPAFRSHLARSHERGYAYEVYVGDWNIEEKHLHYPTGQQSITIAPVLMGAGNFGKIILGVGFTGSGFGGCGDSRPFVFDSCPGWRNDGALRHPGAV
jgi:predicted phage tail protein